MAVYPDDGSDDPLTRDNRIGDNAVATNLRVAAEEWLSLREAEGLRPNSIRAYRDHINSFLNWLGDRELTPLLFMTYFRDAQDRLSVASRQSIYRDVRIFLRAIECTHLMGTMRMPKGETPPKAVYSPGQLRTLFHVLKADKSPCGLRDHAIVCLLRYCGIRASELTALRLSDWQDDDTVLVRGTKSRRSRRTIPLAGPAGSVLAHYLSRGRPKLLCGHADHIFLCRDGRPMTRDTLRQMLDRRSKQVGFPVSAHRFRHTWVTDHIEAGTQSRHLGELAGWSPKTIHEMLDTYGHPGVDSLRGAQRRAFG